MHVTLRTETEDDWRWLWHWRHELDDPDWKKWDSPFLHDSIAHQSYEDFAHRQTINGRTRAIIIVDGQRAGTVHRHELPPSGGGWWDFGIAIYDPIFRRRGVGKEASSLWIKHTFEHTNAHVLTISTWSGNEPMIKLGRDLGFDECSRIPQARLWQGQRYDVVQMALLKEEWKTRRLKN